MSRLHYLLCDIYSLKLFFHVIFKESGLFYLEQNLQQNNYQNPFFGQMAEMIFVISFFLNNAFISFSISKTGFYVDFIYLSILFVMAQSQYICIQLLLCNIM